MSANPPARPERGTRRESTAEGPEHGPVWHAIKRLVLGATRVVSALIALALVSWALMLLWSPSWWLTAGIFVSGGSLLVLSGWLFPRLTVSWPRSLVLLTALGFDAATANMSFRYQLSWDRIDSSVPEILLAVFIAELSAVLYRRRGPGHIKAVLLGGLFAGAVFWAVVAFLGSLLVADFVPTFPVLGLAMAAGGIARAGAGLRGLGRSHRRLRTAIAVVPLVLLVQVCGIAWVAREPAEPVPTPMALAHELRNDLAFYYPYWESDPGRLDGLWGKYSARLRRSAEKCSWSDAPCYPLLRGLRELFAELENGHTKVLIPTHVGRPPVEVRLVDDGTGIEWVKDGSEAERKGLRVGQRLVAVDGVPVEQAAERLPAWMKNYASPRQRRIASHWYVLDGRPGTTVTLTVETFAGERKTVSLSRRSLFLFLEEQDDPGYEAAIEHERVSPNIGYIAIDGFKGRTLVRRFDEALDALMDTDGLILDLRYNGGGSLHLAYEILGRFLEMSLLLGQECDLMFSVPHRPDWGWETRCEERRVSPRGEQYTGKVAVLVDETVASAAEMMTYALCRVGDARCFGRPTAGETDYVVFRDIPGAEIGVSMADFRPHVGAAIQGAGFEPDEYVPITLRDLREDRDRAREVAGRWLVEAGGSG